MTCLPFRMSISLVVAAYALLDCLVAEKGFTIAAGLVVLCAIWML